MTVIPWAINLYTHLIHHLRAHLLNHRRCRDNVMRFYLHCSILSVGGLSVGGLSSISSVEHMCMSVTSVCVTMLTIIVIFRWWITLIGHIMYNSFAYRHHDLPYICQLAHGGANINVPGCVSSVHSVKVYENEAPPRWSLHTDLNFIYNKINIK